MRKIGMFLGVVFALFATPCRATTFVVDPGPTTVQAAIAQAADGDTVLMNPGRYNLNQGTIAIRKPITLKSVAGPTTTIVVNGAHIGPNIVVYSTAGAPTIQGLTIEYGASGGSAEAGGGILCLTANPTIIENLIVGNGAGGFEGGGGRGGGIAVLGGSPTIQRNTIVANQAGQGGLYLEGGAAIVDHNVIAYNYQLTSSGYDSTSGYGYSCNASSATVHDNIFWANIPREVDPQCAGILGINGNVEMDPVFCNPVIYPVDESGWSAKSNSPLAPGHGYFGWGAPTGTCAATDARPTTWGGLKSRYR